AELGRIPLEDAARLVRAFATYFQLVNLAELERQARSVAETSEDVGELDRSVARFAAQRISAERLTATLEELEARPGSTANPPEAARAATLTPHAGCVTEALRVQRRTLLARYRERVRELARDLSQSTRLTQVSDELTASIRRDEAELADYAETLSPGTADEPYRRKLSFVWRRLGATLDGEPATYASADDLAGDLDLLDVSLRRHAGTAVADGDLLRLRRQVRAFGFIGARLDVRQHRAVVRAATIEVVNPLGAPPGRRRRPRAHR